MFNGITERTEEESVRWSAGNLSQGRRGISELTRHLSKAAYEQRLVVAQGEWDAVTQPVLMPVFDFMVSICIRHTQQVLLQQLRTAQH